MDLVVGIGNELRSDDGVGIRVVRALPARRGVETTIVHQLTPDLVEALGRAERVLFVDAHASETRLRLARLARAGDFGRHRARARAGGPDRLDVDDLRPSAGRLDAQHSGRLVRGG